MIKNPVVGMRVNLNDAGLDCIFGSHVGLGHMKSLEMEIVEVYAELCCDDGCKIYDVSVSVEDINQFMISSAFFDEVKP